MAPLFGFYAPLSACRSQRQIEHKEFFLALTDRANVRPPLPLSQKPIGHPIRFGGSACPQMRTSEP